MNYVEEWINMTKQVNERTRSDRMTNQQNCKES